MSRTDQFAFCVVLYEALYGRRPFAARSMEKLKREVLRENVTIPPADSEVPVWLWQIVRKGLSANPEGRFPKIDSLLEELDKDPEELRRQKRLAHRRKLLLVSLILLIIALPIGVWYGLRYRTFQLCRDAEAEFVGVWDDKTKTSMRQAFLGTEKSYAQGTWERVEQSFDKYLVDWMQMRGKVCEARIIRGTQSEELFDLRMSCLRERIGELGALAKVFIAVDARVLQKAVQASSSLTNINLCAEEKALRASYPPPKTKEAKNKVTAIREKLAELEALYKTGKYRYGLNQAKKLEKDAAAVDYPPIQAELLYHLGKLSYAIGEYRIAENTLYEAARVAGLSRDGRLVGSIMSFLVFVVGYAQGRPDDGLLIGKNAEIDIHLSGGDDTLLSRLFHNIGSVYFGLAKYDNALIYYRKALAIDEKTLRPEDLGLAMSLDNMGAVFVATGQYEKALDCHLKVLTIREKMLGHAHPEVAQSLHNLGAVFGKQGEHDKAIVYYRKALVVKEEMLGSNHPKMARTLFSIGMELLGQGLTEQALTPLERAVNICEKKTCEPDFHGNGLFTFARALMVTIGDRQRATRLAKQAREVFKRNPKAFNKELEQVNTWLQKHEAEKLAKKAH